MNPPPDFPYAQLQSAVERQNHGDLAAAQSIYWDILVDHPTQFDALHLLGVTKCQEGRQTEGAWFIQRALEQRPDEPLALFNLGMALSDLHRPREATQLFDRVLAHEPGNPQAWFNRGNALQKQHQHAAAIESYQRALALQPNMPGTLFNMGTALAAIGDTAAAIGLFTQAMEHGADRASCLIGVGKALDEQGDRAGARKCYSDACDSAPDLAEPRWLLALSCLPIIPDGKSEIQQSREMLPAALDGLAAWYDHDTTGRRDRTMFGWPFYLAYQARNNRALMCRFGELRYRLMRQWSAGVAIPLASAIRTNGPIRVGIVSAELYNHCVWHAITRGWFTNLDPSRVTLTAFHVGSKTDDETEIARKHAQALHFGERPLADWARLIAASQLDVLIYPSLGMDPTSANLACLRLAPIQMTSWGHPETTGFPTIDHYLSSQAFEPENADQAYSEALIRLPRLGVCYTPIQADPIPPDLTALGLDAARPIILCPGSPFK
jgi:protein O-GlcNAc transferase